MTHDSRLRRILHFPLTWLAIGVVGVGAASAFTGAGPLAALASAIAALVIYAVVMRVVAGRPLAELAPGRAVRETLLGVAIGTGFIVITVGAITLLGGYRFTLDGAAGLSALPALVAVAIGGAVTEELLFRGLALQAIERLGGSWIALLVTAGLFGLVHAANPGATLWSSIAIAVEAGLMLGAGFLWRRSLWFVFALHATWNGLEQALGIPVSGHVAPGMLVATVDGSPLLTGGAFGLEGSPVTVVTGLALAAAMLVLAHRRGRLVPLRHGRHIPRRRSRQAEPGGIGSAPELSRR